MPNPLSGETLASFATLTFLEIILGIDNLVFLALAVRRLSPNQRNRGRLLGLILAMALRILMLASLVWVANIGIVIFAVLGRSITVKDLVLICGGLFLLTKGTVEIHDEIESPRTLAAESPEPPQASFLGVVGQIGMINIVFSIDSVVTAVGMTSDLWVMIAAVVASTLVMLLAAAPVERFIHSRPTMRMLAFAFILLVGVALIADGIGFHIPRGYVYFAIAFSLFVELLNGAYRRMGGGGGPAKL